MRKLFHGGIYRNIGLRVIHCIIQDYLVAMSLQQEQGEAPGPLSDLELARQLQQEEYQQPQTQQHQPSAGQVLPVFPLGGNSCALKFRDCFFESEWALFMTH